MTDISKAENCGTAVDYELKNVLLKFLIDNITLRKIVSYVVHYALKVSSSTRKNSYEVPQDDAATDSATDGSAKKKGRTVAVTTKDMPKRRNDVKTFGGNEATRKTKKNQLKQQYGNFKAKGKETLEQTFNRLQAIVSHLEFMDVEIEQDDLNQKLLTSLAPEWLMHTIMWRNRSDLDTMTASISLDTACAYIASQSNGYQIKYEDINQINEDDIKEMDIKWNMALLSMRADIYWKKTGKKISIQGTDVAGFDKSKVECFNCHKMGHFAKECRAPKSQDRGRREKYRQEENHALVADEEAPTEFALMAKSSSDNEVLKKEKEGLDSKLIGFQSASKDIDNLIGSQRSDKNKEGLGYIVVPPSCSRVTRETGIILKSQQLGKNFLMKNKACFNCGDFDHLSYDCGKWVDKGKSRPKNNTHKSIPPRAVFHKYNRTPMRINRPHMNDAQPERTYFYKPAHSYVSRPFQRKSAVRTQVRVSRVPTVNRKFSTVNRKFPTGNSKVSTADLGNNGKAGNSQNNIDDKGYWDSGCSRHMTGNISYLSDYEPFDGGYVSFGQGGCKITECIVLGQNFKLKDDTNVLLRTPRQHNMYSIDLNNVVPHKDLTCLVAKASADESMLWHRRLGHLNFKTMNRKQHKASCKTKLVNSVSKPLHTLHMDLFGPTSAKAVNTATMYKTGSCKAFRVFNKRTKKVEENLHVDFLENKLIKKGASPNRLFNIDTLTNSMNYMPVVSAGTTSTNFLGTKEAASQDVKKDVSSLRYIALPNWFREAHLETSTSNAQDACKADAPESSGNSNPTATSTNPPADQMETLTVETLIPTISSPVLTACLDDSPEPSSDTRLISKRVTIQEDTPSLDNILNLSNRFEDILGVTTNPDDTNGVEADLGNMEYNISASPTPTFRIHKDHPKSQIISPVDTPVQTRIKSKEMEEQSFIATIHQKKDPSLLQFCLFSCFLSQEEPKKISDALKDPSWLEAMQEELLQFKIQNV
nr:hypothetical protein [Tanacetum cinerariifolium]